MSEASSKTPKQKIDLLLQEACMSNLVVTPGSVLEPDLQILISYIIISCIYPKLLYI